MTSISTSQKKAFSNNILKWFKQHGRHNLPWQQQPNPYKIWLSEIMLQQTQVVTVINYYQRFLVRFPTIEHLAKAPLDDVLALWAGLGYYARARNLHKTAQLICADRAGEFPRELRLMQSLPGIGESTAAAILTFAMGQSHAILDGNVKRVLTRYFEVEGWSGSSATLKELWALSKALTPNKHTAHFNQAMMDMGATVCTRSQPKCHQCCLKPSCLAAQNQSWSLFPQPKPKKKKPIKQAYFILVLNKQRIYLEKRPPSGIWGGLWSLPEFTNKELAFAWLKQQSGSFEPTQVAIAKNTLLHSFSHFDLRIHLLTLETNDFLSKISDNDAMLVDNAHLKRLGLPTPIKTILLTNKLY